MYDQTEDTIGDTKKRGKIMTIDDLRSPKKLKTDENLDQDSKGVELKNRTNDFNGLDNIRNRETDNHRAE